MDKLTLGMRVEICGVDIPQITGGFGPGKKSLLIKHIAEMHDKKTFHVNEAIRNNRERFVYGADLIDLKAPEYEQIVIGLVDNNFLSKMEVAKSENIYVSSERGYAKLLKVFDDDLAWEKYSEIVDGYFRSRDEAIDISRLGPEMQMFQQIWQGVARAQLEAQEAQRGISQMKEAIATVQETLLRRDEDWRRKINGLLNGAAKRSGDGYQDMRNRSYDLLEERAKCKLSIRLTNLRDRLNEQGATKTKINQTNRMDVIESDPRLKEIYDSIVRELAVGTLSLT